MNEARDQTGPEVEVRRWVGVEGAHTGEGTQSRLAMVEGNFRRYVTTQRWIQAAVRRFR